MYFSPFSILVVVASTNAAYLLPDSSLIFKHCVGPVCPTFRPGSHHAMNCSKGDIVPDPLECQSFYVCNRNGNGIKMMCTFGYAFHPRIKQCVPESFVKSCGKVYCPPPILIGTFPDPANCTRYYRCVYGVPMHYQCEVGFIYDEELGKCWEHGDNVPTCISGESNLVGDTTTESLLITSPPVSVSTTEHMLTTPTSTTVVPDREQVNVSTTTTSVPDIGTVKVITEESIPFLLPRIPLHKQLNINWKVEITGKWGGQPEYERIIIKLS